MAAFKGITILLLSGAVACGGSQGENAAVGRGDACVRDSQCGNAALCDSGRCASRTTLAQADRERLKGGDVAIDLLQHALATGSCPEIPGLRRQLIDAFDADKRDHLVKSLATSPVGDDAQSRFATWLILVDRLGQRCTPVTSRDYLGGLALEARASAAEADVEKWVAEPQCETLASLDRLKLWPFEMRFSAEIGRREFAPAEVTRRLWLATFKKLDAQCSLAMDQRMKVGVQASIEKLERIVGLDDPMLIDLRSRLLDALAKNDSQAASHYALAVSEREKALDARNAAAYDAKVKGLQEELAKAPHKEPPSDSSTSVASTLDTINKGVDTAKKVTETVQLARKVFGF
jgi:hypothetical protein